MAKKPAGWAVLALLLGSLSGCAGDEAAEGTPTEPTTATSTTTSATPPRPVELRYNHSVMQIGLFDIPMSDARGLVPPGFEPTPFDDAGQFAFFSLVVSRSTNTLLDGHDLGESGLAFGGLFVEPPEPHRRQGIENHFHYSIVLSDRVEVVDAFRAWSLPRANNATIELTLPTSTGAQAATGVVHSPDWSFQMDSLASAEQPTDPFALRGFGVENATVVSYVDVNVGLRDHLISRGGVHYRSVSGALADTLEPDDGLVEHVYGLDVVYTFSPATTNATAPNV